MSMCHFAHFSLHRQACSGNGVDWLLMVAGRLAAFLASGAYAYLVSRGKLIVKVVRI